MDEWLFKTIIGLIAGIALIVISTLKSRKLSKKHTWTYLPDCINCPLFLAAIEEVRHGNTKQKQKNNSNNESVSEWRKKWHLESKSKRVNHQKS